MSQLLRLTDRGLYCEPGDFYVDPWKSVERAVITHAHSDHAQAGSSAYLAVRDGANLLRTRLGDEARIETVEYRQSVSMNGVQVSLHPAGHILGSAQVRVEHRGEVAVVSGDYKTQPDPTCAPFELVRCHTFITEATFGLPIYNWPALDTIVDQINRWWQLNKEQGKASLIYCYALGKAQRLLRSIDTSIGPVFTHGAVERLNNQYRASGIELPDTTFVSHAKKPREFQGSLVLAPPSAMGTVWLRRLGNVSTAFASGWMLVRGARRRRSVDRGFPLSDHIDWQNLNRIIGETGAEHVLVTHGFANVMVRWLRERGVNADVLETPFEGEHEETSDRSAPDAGDDAPDAGDALDTDSVVRGKGDQ